VLKVVGVLVVIAATIAALVECAQTREPRALPRWTWLLVILLLPAIGPIAWFVFGRQRRNATTRRGVSAPDDDPRFLRELGDELWSKKQRERRRTKPTDPDLPEPA